ncbi:MAG: transglutaminase domain-containing protein [Sulfurospirillaceae bacterium]|nr:transglutaminase domain-containing protein [Sulfurospirillaceae bacterium]MDD2826804.1 transglutaminase domain-containing protein [Sulfurospirillaceae bacterium]
MKRRAFMQGCIALGTSAIILPQVSILEASESTGLKRIFYVKNSYNLQHENAKALTKLWIPLPLESAYQSMSDFKFNANASKAYVTDKNAYKARTLYAQWDNGGEKILEVTYTITTYERTSDFSKATALSKYSKEVARFLKPTAHIPTSGKVKELALQITKEAKTPLDKAKAIYLWVTENMYRDNSVIGCGVGDAGKAIEQNLLGGKCTDISSVFVALLRSVGVPAREIFGIRLGKSRFSKACGGSDEKGLAKITGAEHCRAEFYINGLGWVPADPADVTKVILVEQLTLKDPLVQKVRDYFFGNWEMNWMGYNYGRDFVLSPEPTQKPLNMFGYPYAEVEDEVLDYYAPASFRYSFISQEKI